MPRRGPGEAQRVIAIDNHHIPTTLQQRAGRRAIVRAQTVPPAFPPLLADRGLVAALGSLAEESPLPVRTDLDPMLDEFVPPEVARATYFVVAELLTNAAKHSRANAVEISARMLWDEPTRLRVAVSDDGRGGAGFTEGHGLTGVQERLHGLRGILTVESPPGGPTRMDVVVPLPSAGSLGAA